MFTVPEVATMLSISEKTVYRLLQRGILKAPAAVGHKLITASSIESFVGETR
jgi:excisionase family DNA binding protein